MENLQLSNAPSIMDNKDRRSVRESVTTSIGPPPRPRYTFVESDMYSLRTNHSRESDFSFLQPEEGEIYDNENHDFDESTNEHFFLAPQPPPMSGARKASSAGSSLKSSTQVMQSPSDSSQAATAVPATATQGQAMYQNQHASGSQHTWASGSLYSNKGIAAAGNAAAEFTNYNNSSLNHLNLTSDGNGSSTVVREDTTIPALSHVTSPAINGISEGNNNDNNNISTLRAISPPLFGPTSNDFSNYNGNQLGSGQQYSNQTNMIPPPVKPYSASRAKSDFTFGDSRNEGINNNSPRIDIDGDRKSPINEKTSSLKSPFSSSTNDSRQTNYNNNNTKTRKKTCIILGIIALILIVLTAVLVPVGILVIKKNDDNLSSHGENSHNSTTTSSSSSQQIPASVNGTVLDINTWLDKTDFNLTYTNATVGGLSIMGLNSSWDDSAQVNPHVPPLNESFPYGSLPIRGVNLGGWLVLEPFITPSYFSNSTSPPIVDEWTLVGSLNESGGMSNVKQTLETHYLSWVSESTLQDIASAGLDHVRIPYGYWAVKTYPGDQYLPQVSWRYLLRAIEWCRKYGLRVSLDLHAVPGSQNGWNHSGHQGYPHWLNGTEGIVYGDESLDLHRQLSAFFSLDRYKNIVTFYGLVNEPKMQTLNNTLVINWTSNAYEIVRNNGYEGNIVFGDGFLGAPAWKGIFPESTYPNMTLDIHQYTIFDSYLIGLSHDAKLNLVCDQWAQTMNISSNEITGHGATLIGEWSQADNDCTLNLNNVGVGSRWEGSYNPGYNTPPVLSPSCPTGFNCTCTPSNTDPNNYSDEYKEYLLQFAELQMEVFESNGGWGSIYWTWDTEQVESSQWSYKKGMEFGILPAIAYQRTYNCSVPVPDYVALGLPENY